MKLLLTLFATFSFSTLATPAADLTKPKPGSDGQVNVCAIPLGDDCLIVEAMPNSKGPKFTMRYVDEMTCVLDCPGEFTANCPANPKSKADASICVNKPKTITRVHCECVNKSQATSPPGAILNKETKPAAAPGSGESKRDSRGKRFKQ